MNAEQLTQLWQDADNARNTMRIDVAADLYNQLFAEYASLGKHEQAAESLQQEGVSFKINKNAPRAFEWLWRAYCYAQRHALPKVMANTLRDIAITCEYIGDHTNAEYYLRQSLRMFEGDVRDLNGHGITLAKLGHLYAKQDNLDQAAELYRQAMAKFDQSPDDTWFTRATTLGHMADLQIRRGRYKRALELISRAMHMFDAHPAEEQTRRRAQLFGAMAYCQAKLGQLDHARINWDNMWTNLRRYLADEAAIRVVLEDVRADQTKQMLGID